MAPDYFEKVANPENWPITGYARSLVERIALEGLKGHDVECLMHPDLAKELWPDRVAEIDRALNEGWGLWGFGGPF